MDILNFCRALRFEAMKQQEGEAKELLANAAKIIEVLEADNHQLKIELENAEDRAGMSNQSAVNQLSVETLNREASRMEAIRAGSPAKIGPEIQIVPPPSYPKVDPRDD